jgi:hypothetical protein
MWVFCCGMRRSGSTLQYQIVKQIVEDAKVGKGLGWVDSEQFDHLQTKYAGENGYLVIKCHSYIENAKKLSSSGKAKAIYVHRDLRDVVVSTMVKDKTSFWQVMRSGLIRTVMEEYTQWNSLNDIMVSKYENMITDLTQETLKISRYIGVELHNTLANKIAEQFTIDQQVQRIQNFEYDKMGKRAGRNVFDPLTLLHENHIHSGKLEQWKTALSSLEVGLVEDIACDWLIEKNYPISQNLFVRKTAAFFSLCLNILEFVPHYARKLMMG